MLNTMRLNTDQAMLLVIDMQTKLLPLIDNMERVLETSCLLVRAAELFELPVIVTEQYPKGIGPTVAELVGVLEPINPATMEKASMSVCGEEPIRERLREIDREQIIICGIEAHVCVQQSVLDLLAMDYQVHVCADAVGSRAAIDYKMALHRMRQSGATVTTAETVLFELIERCDAEKFKPMLELVKSR